MWIVKNRTPGQICNECGVEIKVGEDCVITPPIHGTGHRELEADQTLAYHRLKECLHCAAQ